MIRFLNRDEIDTEKWDSCIHQSLAGHMYALSWHLDAIAGTWAGLIQGDYEAVMPLPSRKKFGINYIFQPIYSQQLGVYGPANTTPKQLRAFISEIPRKYRYIETHLNFTNSIITSFPQIAPRVNYELNLRGSYPEIEREYSSNTRRNMKKSEKEIMISEDIDVMDLINLKRSVDNFRRPANHYQRVENYIHAVLKNSGGEIIGGRVQDRLVAAAFFARYGNRIYYLIPVSNSEGKKLSAMTKIIDHLIRKNAGTSAILDFEGSTIPGIARFFKGFGATGLTYYNLKLNRLPWPVKWIKK